MRRLLVLAAAVGLSGCIELGGPGTPAPSAGGAEERPLPPRRTRPTEYCPSGMCKNCHVRIYEQQSKSMHARAYENPVFQAQYYKETLPLAYEEERFFKEARSCAACHMPIA